MTPDDYPLIGGPLLKCARFNNREIHIHTYSREHLQFLFDEARKDRITCKYCGLPLRLKLSIHEEPHFSTGKTGIFLNVKRLA